MHEAQLYDSNLFVTLDYAPEHLPKSLSLEYKDFCGFMKRLRKEVRGVSRSPGGTFPIRFFVAGEYGERFSRPHWHAILFNTRFEDQIRFCNDTYRSVQCERLWKRGQVVIGSVTPRSAAYVAGYTLNKRYGRPAADHYEDVVSLETGEVSSRRPEFCVMSRRPGIGAWWFDSFGKDLFPHDHAIVDGRRYRVPGYYWRKYQEIADAFDVEAVLNSRVARAQAVPVEESSVRRRGDRAIVAKAKLDLYGERSH